MCSPKKRNFRPRLSKRLHTTKFAFLISTIALLECLGDRTSALAYKERVKVQWELEK